MRSKRRTARRNTKRRTVRRNTKRRTVRRNTKRRTVRRNTKRRTVRRNTKRRNTKRRTVRRNTKRRTARRNTRKKEQSGGDFITLGAGAALGLGTLLAVAYRKKQSRRIGIQEDRIPNALHASFPHDEEEERWMNLLERDKELPANTMLNVDGVKYITGAPGDGTESRMGQKSELLPSGGQNIVVFKQKRVGDNYHYLSKITDEDGLQIRYEGGPIVLADKIWSFYSEDFNHKTKEDLIRAIVEGDDRYPLKLLQRATESYKALNLGEIDAGPEPDAEPEPEPPQVGQTPAEILSTLKQLITSGEIGAARKLIDSNKSTIERGAGFAELESKVSKVEEGVKIMAKLEQELKSANYSFQMSSITQHRGIGNDLGWLHHLNLAHEIIKGIQDAEIKSAIEQQGINKRITKLEGRIEQKMIELMYEQTYKAMTQVGGG
jgi:hypothetical protein